MPIVELPGENEVKLAHEEIVDEQCACRHAHMPNDAKNIMNCAGKKKGVV